MITDIPPQRCYQSVFRLRSVYYYFDDTFAVCTLSVASSSERSNSVVEIESRNDFPSEYRTTMVEK